MKCQEKRPEFTYDATEFTVEMAADFKNLPAPFAVKTWKAAPNLDDPDKPLNVPASFEFGGVAIVVGEFGLVRTGGAVSVCGADDFKARFDKLDE